MSERPTWKADLDFYGPGAPRALEFVTQDDFDRALEDLYSPTLQEMPFQLLWNKTIVVPAEAERFFEGLSFRSIAVTRTGSAVSG